MLVNKLTALSPEARTGSEVWKGWYPDVHWEQRVGDLSAPRPCPTPTPPCVRALTAHAEQRHGRGAGEPPPRPLSFQQVPRLLPQSAPRLWPLFMVPVAGSALPLPRTRSNSHRLRGFSITGSPGRQAGYWARQHGAIAGRKERAGLPPSTPPHRDPSGRRTAPPVAPRLPANQLTPSPPAPPPHQHVGGGASRCLPSVPERRRRRR